MAGYDAQSQNTVDRDSRKYTDLDLFFGKKSSDSDISTVKDVQAVKRSIRNLVQLNSYDKPFHPEITSGVREMLFELMSPVTAAILARKIEDVINNFEPTIKNLLKFLQVEWTDNLSEFYKTAENKRIISTPSYDQVNKPLYSQSIGRWKNYEDQFIETSKIFEKWNKEFNY